MGQLGSQRSDLVLPSIAHLWPVRLDEELFGVETMPDSMCSLQGAEIGNLAVFNPTTKKYVFQPTTAQSLTASPRGLPSGQSCLLQRYWKSLTLEKSG